MAHWASEWLIPIGTLLTALAALVTVFLVRKQLYWEKAPIIEITFFQSREIVEGPHLRNKPVKITELDKWNEQGTQDLYLIAEFTNKQTDPMGVATSVQFEAKFVFPHPSHPMSIVERSWKFSSFWLAPSEKFWLVIANLRGLPVATVDITKLSCYDIRGIKHSEARGYCALTIAADGKVVRGFKSLRRGARCRRKKRKNIGAD